MQNFYHLLAQFDSGPLPKVNPDQASIKTVLQIVFSVIGAVAVLIIAIAGFQYVISQGEPQAISKAKNTIVYAVIGVVVSLAAFSLVTFFLKNV